MRHAFDLEKSDIQGLVASGYGRLRWAVYVPLEIVDASKARSWLGTQIPGIRTAADEHEGTSCFNLAITAQGLLRLGLNEQALKLFPLAFREGMVEEHRSRILGDDDDSLRQWRWGTPEKRCPDVLVLVYASDNGELRRRLRLILAGEPGMSVLRVLSTHHLQGYKEHFGFADGIGQPTIEGFEEQYLAQMRRTGRAVSLKPGEFLLGYTNEFGTITEENNDFGRNGAYLVFRQMQQHVNEFRSYFGNGEEGRRRAAKAVGRWPNGTPLTLAPEEDDACMKGADDFSYANDDPHGHGCPIGAHIRRANPRDSLEKDTEEAMRRSRRRRLLRRGRSYGLADGIRERGLHFICLCGDLERQFEFVQHTWLGNPAFAGLCGETDPLTGARLHPEGGRFTIQKDPVRERLEGMPQFVTVRGGGYFFLPGMRALWQLAGK